MQPAPKLASQLRAALTSSMSLPLPIEQLFSWMEDNELYLDQASGQRVGFLFPEQQLRDGWSETERVGGTIIRFETQGNRFLKHWFGHERPEILDRLCVFATSGADGSMASFWLSPEGEQRIVHLGSGSGSLMTCVLANSPVDFLRLLAIGYDEICWSEEFDQPPNTRPGETLVHPNVAFQQWVRETFGVTIPKTAREIVAHPDDMGKEGSEDAFNVWVSENVA